MIAGGELCHPEGSASGPGIDSPWLYATLRRSEKAGGIVSGKYTIPAFNLMKVTREFSPI